VEQNNSAVSHRPLPLIEVDVKCNKGHIGGNFMAQLIGQALTIAGYSQINLSPTVMEGGDLLSNKHHIQGLRQRVHDIPVFIHSQIIERDPYLPLPTTVESEMEKVMNAAMEYAHKYSFVGDDSMVIAKNHLQEVLSQYGQELYRLGKQPVHGLPLEQEPKYTVDGNHVINRSSGEAIPHEEPVFIFRGRDSLAVTALMLYVTYFNEATPHYKAIMNRIDDFKKFAKEYPDRMKMPDTVLQAGPLEQLTKENVIAHNVNLTKNTLATLANIWRDGVKRDSRIVAGLEYLIERLDHIHDDRWKWAGDEAEYERMRLAACGIAALGNTEEAVKQRIGRDHQYFSASYDDVCRSVDAEIKYRDEAAALKDENEKLRAEIAQLKKFNG
jgi:hypothetical protein